LNKSRKFLIADIKKISKSLFSPNKRKNRVEFRHFLSQVFPAAVAHHCLRNIRAAVVVVCGCHASATVALHKGNFLVVAPPGKTLSFGSHIFSPMGFVASQLLRNKNVKVKNH
jgi:hypothetical protein